jgi:hypothetical protein
MYVKLTPDSINQKKVKEAKRKLKYSASARFLSLSFRPEDGGSIFVRLISELLPDTEPSHPER